MLPFKCWYIICHPMAIGILLKNPVVSGTASLGKVKSLRSEFELS